MDACAAYSTMELPIALNTTLLWDVSGIEGEREQGEQDKQVQEVNLVQQMRNWKVEMKKLEQCRRWQVKEVLQDKQEAIQKP